VGTSVEEVCRKKGISRRDVLQLAQEIRRTASIGAAPPASARGGEQQLKRLVADLSLDKAMLQDVLSKKL